MCKVCKLCKQKNKLIAEQDQRDNERYLAQDKLIVNYLNELSMDKKLELIHKMALSDDLDEIAYEYDTDAGKVLFYISEDLIEDEDLFFVVTERFWARGIDYIQKIYDKLVEIKPKLITRNEFHDMSFELNYTFHSIGDTSMKRLGDNPDFRNKVYNWLTQANGCFLTHLTYFLGDETRNRQDNLRNGQLL